MFADSATKFFLDHISSVVAAVGGLGTAAYGLVDASKSIFGGVSNRGFACVAKTMAVLLPERSNTEKSIAAATHADTAEPPTAPALSLNSILVSLRSNWINGVPHNDQVAIAKSLVKLRLNSRTAPFLAALTGVNAQNLASVAQKIATGAPMDKEETDDYGRFDLVLTTLLDQAYQRADQQYRNTAKLCAVGVSVALAVFGAAALGQIGHPYLKDTNLWRAVTIGLLATPLAPVAKDIASAIQAGAKAVQAWRS